MRRDTGRRRIYRSRAVRRRRSVFAVFIVAVCIVVALAGVVLAAGQSGGRTRERVTYDRSAAAAYADQWALGNNPRYWSSPDNDCANFVSQCLAAGGLRPLNDPGVEWYANATELPTIAWVNCVAQRRALAARAGIHTRYIARSTRRLPRGWAAGDVVYLGNTIDGKDEWQHVIICVGKTGGTWVYDSHTAAHLRQPLEVWYPEHFSLVRYCHVADAVSYAEGD
ncbi:MAG: amidase domain-containing protein [Actinomycetes bacterium]